MKVQSARRGETHGFDKCKVTTWIKHAEVEDWTDLRPTPDNTHW
jgi:hypothetical protein